MKTSKYSFSEPSDKQVQALCKDFIRMYGKGRSWDAMEARIAMMDIWGVNLDWHEFSYALDTLRSNDEAQIDYGHSHSMTGYYIKS